jgi:hypothetical protein
MNKELDISHIKFSESWNGVRVMYRPGSAIALMEIHSWDETRRFRIDFGKGISIDQCPIDEEELQGVIWNKIVPKLQK